MADLISPGRIRFYDRLEPILPGGDYEIILRQKIVERPLDGQPAALETIDLLAGFFDDEEKTQQFQVAPVRLRLTPQQVHAVFPPPSTSSDYSEMLPHIVLRQTGLPWERDLGDYTVAAGPQQGLQHRRPCLALLLFTTEEMVNIQQRTLPAAQIAGGTTDRFNVSNNVLRPRLSAADFLDPTGNVLDIPRALFAAIAPQLDDLPFLSHVREVNTGDKEIVGLREKGRFAVVISNRRPQPPAGAENGRHIAHLVSLVGWREFLTNPLAAPPEATTLRLVTLASWEFDNAGSGGRGSFKGLMSRLSSGLLQLPPPESTAPEGNRAAQFVSDALNQGFVPLEYNTRFHHSSIAWYRGPLVPQPVPRILRRPFPGSEAGLILDERTGLFDVSLAVAWQLGRLLALSNAGFAAAVGRFWRRGVNIEDLWRHQRDFFTQYEAQILPDLHALLPNTNGDSAGFPDGEELIDEILKQFSPDAVSRAITAFTLSHDGLLQQISGSGLFGRTAAGAPTFFDDLADTEKERLLTLSPADLISEMLQIIRRQQEGNSTE